MQRCIDAVVEPPEGGAISRGRVRRRLCEVAEGFVLDGRDVDARQIARPEQPRELDRIPAGGLHRIAGLLRHQGGRPYVTGESLSGQVAIEGVPARSGLVREHQRRRLRLESPDQFVEVRLARPDVTDELRWVGGLPLGMGDGHGIFVDVQTDEQRSRLRHG